MSDSSDIDLLLAMRTGDNAAARTLHARVGPRMLAYARALVHDDLAAEDACQQAWLHAMSCPAAQARAVRDVPAWMVAICRNALLSAARSRSRRTRRELHAAPRGPDQPPPPAETEEAMALRRAIDDLGEEHRDLVLLRHVAGLTFDQLAHVLDQPRSTLASRHSVALDALRAALTNDREATHA